MAVSALAATTNSKYSFLTRQVSQASYAASHSGFPVCPSHEGGVKNDLNELSVEIHPDDVAKRQVATWRGLSGEVIQMLTNEPFEASFQASRHLLIAYQRAVRRDGETIVEGLPRSTLRNYGQKLTFVPAGCSFKESQIPSVSVHATFLFIDPAGPLLDREVGFDRTSFTPRLFFENPILFETAGKLKALIESGGSSDRLYAEALGVVLAHELMRLDARPMRSEHPACGGLADWQKKKVSDYIDNNLWEEISLASLAAMVHLSLYHFSRAFKQSFGMPPHRCHAQRRIERAKALLAERKQTITEIALNLGFSDSSSFTRVFNKFAGRTPSDYRRSVI
jgi:AraC family transcriptional regulator